MAVSFSQILNEELKRRTRLNSGYSIRAFARKLKVDHSHLAKVLNHKCEVSERFVEWTGWTLNWSSEKIAQSKQLEGVSHKKSGRKIRGAEDLKFRSISFDEFQMISRQIHFTILEMTQLSDFVPTQANIAKRLEVDSLEIGEAIKRLKKLSAVTETPQGLRLNHKFTTTKNQATSAALKRLQTEILTRATRALDQYPIEERDQTGITMAIDSSKIDGAKRRITKFRRELMRFLEGDSKRDRVYQLSISLFPLERGAR